MELKRFPCETRAMTERKYVRERPLAVIVYICCYPLWAMWYHSPPCIWLAAEKDSLRTDAKTVFVLAMRMAAVLCIL